jgi:outer membrane receptor protein involved in Fe transport
MADWAIENQLTAPFHVRMAMQPGTRWVLVLCAVPSMVLGQRARPTLQVGERVRITARADTGIYIVRAMSNDTLTVQLPKSTALAYFPFATVHRVEVSRGKASSKVGRNGMIGLVGGAAIGGLLGFASGDDPPRNDPVPVFQLDPLSRNDKAALGAIGLGVVGLVGGVLSGISRGERWERVSLPPRVSVSGRGDGVLALSYSF